MNFKEQLEAKRRAAQGRPVSHEKPVSELSDAELDREVESAKQRLRTAREREAAAAREVTSETTGNRPLFPRKTRRPWR